MRSAGPRGERLAARYLVRRGWRILDRNWRGGGGELDIVALRGGLVAFVEVKTRGDPEALAEPITAAQRTRLIRAATAYLARHDALRGCSARFDLMGVDTAPPHPRIHHLADAFQAPVEPIVERSPSKSVNSGYATDLNERR